MRRAAERRAFAYHFERVKQPLLADLAVRMTAAGVTALAVDEAALVETRLAARRSPRPARHSTATRSTRPRGG
jgi:hypothetical protein